MEGIIVLIVYGCFLVGIFRLIKMRNARAMDGSKMVQSKVAPVKQASDIDKHFANNSQFEKPVTKNHDHKKDSHNINKQLFNENPGSLLKDDRANDWMARELKEEKAAAAKVRIMFDLKEEHHSSCEAEMIRRFHEDNCDADKVDTAKA